MKWADKGKSSDQSDKTQDMTKKMNGTVLKKSNQSVLSGGLFKNDRK